MEVIKRRKKSILKQISLRPRFLSYFKYLQIISIFQRLRYKRFRKK